VSAILRLAQGDMRRVLNVLQATCLGFPTVTEDSVYACTGDPSPKDIRKISQSLLTDTVKDSFMLIRGLQAERGLALGDILSGVGHILERMAMPSSVKARLFSDLARIEARLAAGTPDKHQVGALIAAFHVLRDALEEAKEAA
jgi:replication factor C subunit 3/5